MMDNLDLKYLFNDNKLLYEYLDEREQEFITEIKSFTLDEIRNTYIEVLTNLLVEKYQEEMVRITKLELNPDIFTDTKKGLYVLTGYITFEGDARFFKYRTRSHFLRAPLGLIEERIVIIQAKSFSLSKEDFKREINDIMDLMKKYLAFAEQEVAEHNGSLYRRIKTNLVNRLRELETKSNIVSSLGYDVKDKQLSSSSSITYPSPKVKRKLRLNSKIPTETIPLEKEPILEWKEYEHILNLLYTIGTSMERDPASYSSFKESVLRTQLLTILNTHYSSSTGETFNFLGKTDLLIRDQGKSIFIGECAIWYGPNTLTEKIDQILNYTSWRDTKTAIILFCKNKDFSSVLKQFDGIVKQHNNHIRKDESFQKESQTRHVLRNKIDKDKHLILTILAFNLCLPSK